MTGVIKVNKLEGRSAADNITVTVDSVTMQLQNGLAKAFCNFNLGTHVAGETLNNSSISDTGTGLADLNFTNNFNTATYASASANPAVSSIASRNFSSGTGTQATNKCGYAREASDGTANAPDAFYQALTHFGDLA